MGGRASGQRLPVRVGSAHHATLSTRRWTHLVALVRAEPAMRRVMSWKRNDPVAPRTMDARSPALPAAPICPAVPGSPNPGRAPKRSGSPEPRAHPVRSAASNGAPCEVSSAGAAIRGLPPGQFRWQGGGGVGRSRRRLGSGCNGRSVTGGGLLAVAAAAGPENWRRRT